MDPSTVPGLSQSRGSFTPFAGVAQAGDIDLNGDLVGMLTLRLAAAIDVDSDLAAAQLEHVRGAVIAARAPRDYSLEVPS